MKIRLHHSGTGVPPVSSSSHRRDARATEGRRKRTKTGSATLVVLVLLGLMSMLMVANSRSLSLLKRQLDSVEQRQLQKFKPPVAERQEVKQNSAAP